MASTSFGRTEVFMIHSLMRWVPRRHSFRPQPHYCGSRSGRFASFASLIRVVFNARFFALEHQLAAAQVQFNAKPAGKTDERIVLAID